MPLTVVRKSIHPGRIQSRATAIRAGWNLLISALITIILSGGLMLHAFDYPPQSTVPTHALRFDDKNHYVEVLIEEDFDLVDELTLEAWIKVDSFTQKWQAIVTKGKDWGIVRNNKTSTLAFRTRGDSGEHVTAGVTAVDDGVWHHVAAVYDGTVKALYLDGALESEDVHSDSIDLNNRPLQFGNNDQDSKADFVGEMDTVRVWSTARTELEIKTDAGRELRGDEPGLLGEWRFDEASGNQALDSSAGQRHAFLVNLDDGDRVDGIDFLPPPPLATVPAHAIRFDGDARRFVRVEDSVPALFDLAGTSHLTIEAWVNFQSISTAWQSIVTRGEAWGILQSGSTGKVVFRTFDGTAVHDLESSTEFLPDRWYHIAAVYDGIEKQLLIDGAPDASVAYTQPLTDNGFPLAIGFNTETAANPLDGIVDEVRVWSIARSESEIASRLLMELRGDEPGLLGNWRFNEPSGETALDISHNEANGTLVQLPDSFRVDGLHLDPAGPPVAGFAKGALNLRGSDGTLHPRIVITEEPAFDLQTDFTIELWLNVTAFDVTDQSILSKGDAWELRRSADSSDIEFAIDLGFKNTALTGVTALSTGRWYHVAVVVDGVEVRLYVDGRLDARTTLDGSVAVNDSLLVLGGNANHPETSFNGLLDAVRIWTVPRSREEIVYQADRLLRGNETGLLSDWRFNEAAGTTATDSSANGYGGTLTDMDDVADRVDGLFFREPADGDLAVVLNTNGVFQFITVGPDTILDITGDLLIEAWLYFDDLPTLTTVALVSKGDDAWELNLKDSGKIEFLTAGLGPDEAMLSSTTINRQEWHHVAAVRDSAAGVKRIYIDGILDAEESGLSGSVAVNTLPLLFGARPSLFVPPTGPGPDPGSGPPRSNFYHGLLDEVRVWSSARTPELVQDGFNRGVHGTEPFLVGAWSMNSGSGSTAINSRQGSTLHGSFSGTMSDLNRVEGVVLGDPLPGQYAYQFTGSDYFVVPHSDAMNMPGAGSGDSAAGKTGMTLEAWIRPGGTGFRTILYKGDQVGGAGYGLAIDANNHLRFFIDPFTSNALSSAAPVTNDTWQHVAVVVNTDASTTTFYINGVPAGNHDQSVLANNTTSLQIGRQGNLTLPDGNFYVGDLDEVRLWNVARSALEIELLAFRELPLNTDRLVGYWTFNEGTGTSLTDASINRLDGTLSGGGVWIQGNVWNVSGLPDDLVLTLDPASAGLWAGQAVLGQVNEIEKAIGGESDDLTPTADSATIRVLMHVNQDGQVNLLKDVIIMKDPDSGDGVLLTDPSLIPDYSGIVERGGKLVGMRFGSVAYEFDGLELPMLGGVGPGVGCIATMIVAAGHPNNPFRHKYHPDHRDGYLIQREISIQFDDPPDPVPALPDHAADELHGNYSETITGLHKIPLKTGGRITLHRISSIPELNDSI